MNDDTLGTYEAYYQFHDPITTSCRRAGCRPWSPR
jgi:hypothetical protein